MGSTTAVGRHELPYPSANQFIALEALLEAYYALNTAGTGADPDSRAWAVEGKHTPMGHVRTALVQTLKLVPGVSLVVARRILNECIQNSEGVEENYHAWREGQI